MQARKNGTLCDGTDSPGSGVYCIPVFPDGNTKVTALISTVGGQNITVEKPVSLTAGTNTVNFTVDFVPLPQKGSVEGTITANGPKPVDQRLVTVSCPSSNRRTLVNANGPYLIPDLNEGLCSMRAFTQYNDPGAPFSLSGTNFTFPDSSFSPTQTPTVTSGSTAIVNITSGQTFLEGNFIMTGTRSLSEVTSLKTRALAVSGSPSAGGQGEDPVNLQTGAYELVLSPGIWSNHLSCWSFQNLSSDPSEVLEVGLTYRDEDIQRNPISLAAGETLQSNMQHRFGDVTIIFSIAGGGVFSNPRVNTNGFSCTQRDESNQLLYSYNLAAFNSSQQNVSQGVVNFTGQEATCTVTARATVDGSLVTFGDLTFDVVAGAEIIVDIGGPALNVEFPLPDEIIDAANILVTGTVTDDVEVASVTVNGVAASLDSTNNPNDPAEVSFSATIPIVKGPNQVVTVATDAAGKTAQDTRTVFSDSGPPDLAFTPADGTVTTATAITVEGIASNDAGVTSVIVNGVSVALTPTGNPNDFTQVSFSTPLTLQLGANSIAVVATDISNLTVSETHSITVTDNEAPVCQDQYINVDEDGLAIVRLNCSDADEGDTIEIELVALDLVGVEPIAIAGSSPDFDVTVVPQPDPNGSGGTFTFQAIDSNGAMSTEATATITVNPVNDLPDITGLATDLTLNEGESLSLNLDPSVTDVETTAANMSWAGVSSASPVADVSISGDHLVTINAIDGGGNAGIILTVTDCGDLDNCAASSNACDGSESAAHSTTITVSNLAPTVVAIASQLDPVQVGAEINASASFTDAGILDTHTAVWDWGDGLTTDTVTESDGSGSVADTHTYGLPGVYTVKLTVTDKDGDSGESIFQFVVVYDPSAGFVTGGGWIYSDPGAFAGDPTLEGKANFGFVAKYKKGASIPSGQTEFRLKVAGLDFHSDDYQWLVVSGPTAKFKGTGTINGAGNYGFMVTATDEKLTPSTSADRFRIKIWDIDENDAIVYDNKSGADEDSDAGTGLQGGNIVIHKKK